MAGKEPFEGQLKVYSLTRIGTVESDHDVGVVRVSGSFLQKHARRNALVKICVLNNDGKEVGSIVRVARAATRGGNALSSDEIGLQYDDRLELGIKNAGTTHQFRIKQVGDYSGLPRFLLRHPSPLVRKEAIFALALMIVGVLIGALVGFVIGIAI
jgi:hypothetical protein